MQNLIDQVGRDKIDNKNKESLKRMQQKAVRMNAVSNEKKVKDETINCERMEREQLLDTQMRDDETYMDDQRNKAQVFARNLK